MNKIEYTYIDDDIINVIVCKPSQNKKLGLFSNIIGTYHFGIDQVLSADLTEDSASCLDCPLSYTSNGGKTGGCYTHMGLQRLGLNVMLKRLSRELRQGKIKPFNSEVFNDTFITPLKHVNIDLTRFGIFGEPVHLPIKIVKSLILLSKSYTAYSHQWMKPQYQGYNKYFRASTHNVFETALANDMGWRVFNVGAIDGAVNCPASKEAGRKSTCAACSLCSGTEGKGNKNVFILKH